MAEDIYKLSASCTAFVYGMECDPLRDNLRVYVAAMRVVGAEVRHLHCVFFFHPSMFSSGLFQGSASKRDVYRYPGVTHGG